MKPLVVVDAFSKQGGAGMGYYRAGFRVIGVDIEPQPRYPFEFIQGDAIEIVGNLIADGRVCLLHGSPPCRLHSRTQKIRGNDHPDFIAPFRELAQASGLPYVIENVVGAPLIDPVMLCGAMFPSLNVYRHRLFETNVDLAVPSHPQHLQPQTKMGRKLKPGERMQVVGNFNGAEDGRQAMGIDWMTRDGLREAIPPAYTEYLGFWLMREVLARAA